MWRILFVVALCWALPVSAAVTFTCTRDATFFGADGRLVVGKCIASGTLSAAGDAIGASTSQADTNAAVCGSSVAQLIRLVLSTENDGDTTGAYWTWDSTNRKVIGLGSNGAAAALLSVATGTTVPTNVTLAYTALCR